MIIGEICAVGNYSKKYFMRKSMYDKLSKKFKKFYFINCHYLVDKENIKIEKEIKSNKNIFFFHPKNYKELDDFLKVHKIFLINNISFKFYHLKIHILLNKENIFQVQIDNLGEMTSYNIENWKSVDIKKKFYFVYLKKIPLIIYKILNNINIIKPIDILYLARKDIKKNYERKKSFYFLSKKKYTIIKPVKPKLNLNFDKNLNEKFIVFIDQNLNHRDSIIRGYELNIKEQKKYFYMINKYLSSLKKIYNKKIVICLHPSSNIGLYKKNLKRMKIVKHRTDYFLSRAFVVVFHDSSSILSAILQKKRIIQLTYSNLGKLTVDRGKIYQKYFDFYNEDLNLFKNINKKRLSTKLNSKLKNYTNFLKKIFFIEDKYKDINDELIIEINKFKNKNIIDKLN
tara:strand:- start:87 stop:1283 length:1197 start_codon:yes stop_codon:yes gene_type:complete